MSELSHVDSAGAARMVDVSAKTATARTALAGGTVRTTATPSETAVRKAFPTGSPSSTTTGAGTS